MDCVVPSWPRKTIQLSSADRNNRPVVTHCAPASPMTRQPNPAMIAPMSGAKRMICSIGSALHHVDVFDRDGAAGPEEANEDGKADGRLCGGDSQHEQGKDLPDQIAK